MECESNWMGKFYRPENVKEEEMLRKIGKNKIVAGFGMGWWH